MCVCLFYRIIVNIIHTTSDYLPKVLRFLNVAFDSSGDCLIAGDHQGNIYVFDLSGNRWVILLIFTLFNVTNSLTFSTCYYLLIQKDLLSSYYISGIL